MEPVRRSNFAPAFTPLPRRLLVYFCSGAYNGVSLAVGSQYADQYPQQLRAAIQAIGTHISFQLSSADAEKTAAALDGGKWLAELLKNLPQRHFVIKSGHAPWQHAVVPNVEEPRLDAADLYRRSQMRWAKRRADIEAEINARHQQLRRNSDQALGHEWE